MRASRVIRLLIRVFILILSLSVTIVAFLGGWSAILILMGGDENIGVDTDNADFDIQINNSTFEIEDFSFSLPFNLTNSGYFDLENLELSISLDMNYSHIDDPVPGVNTTRQVEIFRRTQNFGTIPKGTTGVFTFTGDMSNFINTSLPDFTTEVDWYRGPPPIEFYADLIISLEYTIGLHSLTIGLTNLPVGGLP